MKRETISKSNLNKNMDKFDSYLNGKNEEKRLFAINLLTAGHDFVYRIVEGKYRFYPSRYIGYANNSFAKHKVDQGDGKKTNHILNATLECKCYKNDLLSEKYNEYVNSVKPDNKKTYNKKKFWDRDLGGKN